MTNYFTFETVVYNRSYYHNRYVEGLGLVNTEYWVTFILKITF